MQDSECDFDDDGEYDYRPGHPHNLSRVCTNNSAVYGCDDEGDSVGGGNYFNVDDGCCDTISTHMSQLSMESFTYGDADEHEEFSDDERESKEISGREVSSNSDQESLGDCYSLPATPPRPRSRNHGVGLDQVLQLQPEKHKEYFTSKNKAKLRMNTTRRDRYRLERTSFGAHDKKKVVAAEDEAMIDSSGEEGSGDLVGSSVVIRTRPRGGRRSLCMDLDEVKACRDLGFDLEHDHCTTLHHSSSSVAVMPTTTTTSLSISENANLDTSSGTNSPITKWRISSPGQLQSSIRQTTSKELRYKFTQRFECCFLHLLII